MSTRTSRWRTRVMSPGGANAPLDYGRELWVWDVTRYESVSGIRVARVRAGLPTDDDAVVADATRDLVIDLVDAAGGVKRAHGSLRRSAYEAQVGYECYVAGNPAAAGDGAYNDLDHVENTWYFLEGMLVWVRILGDRLRRDAATAGCKIDQGLIPALAGGARKQAICAARDRILGVGGDEARCLATLNLTCSPIVAAPEEHSSDPGAWYFRSPTRSGPRSPIRTN